MAENGKQKAGSGWRREELRVYQDGVQALAAAVLRQWKKDGMPKSDLEGVEPWARVVEEAEKMRDERKGG